MNYNIDYCVNPLSGDTYFNESVSELNDTVKDRIEKSIHKLSSGNFGNCFPIKNNFGKCDSMFEMRINHQVGYRIYYRKIMDNIIIASVGCKKKQKSDIVKAREQLSIQ